MPISACSDPRPCSVTAGRSHARSVEILAETDTRVVHCPRARRVYFFKGRLPIPELIEAGVLVGLGSDACGMDRPYDSIWEDMFMAPRWQRLELNDPNLIPSGKLLEMATIDGARIVGMDDITGSIEVGQGSRHHHRQYVEAAPRADVRWKPRGSRNSRAAATSRR